MASNYTLKIDAGADFFLRVQLEDDEGELIEMNGFSARMKLKEAYDSEEPMIDVDSGSKGGITFENFNDETDVNVDSCVIHLTNEQTGTLVDYSVLDSDGEVEQGEGVYDLEIVDEGGNVLRAIQGSWIAYQEVTRP